jgi:hypothetical protein
MLVIVHYKQKAIIFKHADLKKIAFFLVYTNEMCFRG